MGRNQRTKRVKILIDLTITEKEKENLINWLEKKTNKYYIINE